jgi:formylglycine-generating enzyme required for sulfatase activity
VTGGNYYRTYTNSGNGPVGEADPATVSNFHLDKYLVTVGRFRQFVTAWNQTGYAPSGGSGKHTHLNGGNGLNNETPGSYEPGWVARDDVFLVPTTANLSCDPNYATWTPTVSGREGLPINCVNWYEAYAFCIWDGGFLPSEAEWEYAAAGGNEERKYPWGSTDPGTANQYAIYGCYYPNGAGTCTGVDNIAPVGTTAMGIGRWGQLDLAGLLAAWNLDYSPPHADPYAATCSNFANSLYVYGDSARMIRGGLFNVSNKDILTPTRVPFGTSTTRSFLIGIRCARTP